MTQLAQAIRDRQVTAVEALEAHLNQIEQHSPKLNAVIALYESQAREQAQAADEALARGEIRGPLHGVPMTVKEHLDTY